MTGGRCWVRYEGKGDTCSLFLVLLAVVEVVCSCGVCGGGESGNECDFVGLEEDK